MEDNYFLGLADEVLKEEFGHASGKFTQQFKELKLFFFIISGVTYLDHAGATLYSCKQLRDHMADLSCNLYANPHSRNPSSTKTTAIIDGVREAILRHFNTTSEEYDIIFTSGCTAALSLLSQSFPWQSGRGYSSTCSGGSEGKESPCDGSSSSGSTFCYLDDNHTSVIGMREVARASGAKSCCVTRDDLVPVEDMAATESISTCNHLFAYPAQSNFSGFKYPLSWCRDIPEQTVVIRNTRCGRGQWKVALDGASFVSSSPLDLSCHQPDFLTISFYKIFGFPTGLGALLVHRDSQHLLSKSYYGGGTVRATDSWTNFHVGKDTLHDR